MWVGGPPNPMQPIRPHSWTIVRSDTRSSDDAWGAASVKRTTTLRIRLKGARVTFPNAGARELWHRNAWDATGMAVYHPAMGLGRFLNLDRLAGRFNQWIGATAMADKAAVGTTGSPGRSEASDPSAVVGVLGEIERQYSGSDTRREDEDLPPFNLEPLKHHEPTPRSDETARSDD